MPEYEMLESDHDVCQAVAALVDAKFNAIALCHPPLRIGVRFARSSKEGVPAIKSRGYPAYATIKVVSLENRMQGANDVLISIDQHEFNDMDSRKQEALLVHELMHVEFPDADEGGGMQLDSHGRPVVKLRAHDFQIGGFYDVCVEYGEDAIERRQIAHVASNFRQIPLPFDAADPMALISPPPEDADGIQLPRSVSFPTENVATNRRTRKQEIDDEFAEAV